MAITVTHPFHSEKSDSVDSTLIKPSDWNNGHLLTTDASGFVMGRDSSGAGDIQQLPLAVETDGTVTCSGTKVISPPQGTTLARPATPRSGSIRYNTTTGQLEIYGLTGAPTSWTVISAGATVTAGFVMAFAGATPPAGWVLCNHHTENRVTRADLFAAIGTTYGIGNGATTFNVPDYRDCVLVGVGTTYSLAGRRGSLTTPVTVGIGNMPNHNHAMYIPAGNFGLGGVGGGDVWQAIGGPTGVTTETTGGGAAISVPVEQPGVGVNVCIKL